MVLVGCKAQVAHPDCSYSAQPDSEVRKFGLSRDLIKHVDWLKHRLIPKVVEPNMHGKKQCEVSVCCCYPTGMLT